jgi:hypothetical protein
MQKRNVLNSPRLSDLKKRKRKAILLKIILYFLTFIIALGSLAYISGLKNLNINNIVIKGNEVIEIETIRAVVEQTLSGKYLWLFPKTNVLIYPESPIKNDLQNSFKRINELETAIIDDRTLVVTLSEREAKYTWCGNVLPEANDDNQECYFLDEDGYLFDKAPYFSGEVYFKFYGEVDKMLGSYFFKEHFKKFVSFKDALINMGLKPTALYIVNNDVAEIFLSKGSSAIVTPRIIFNPNANFQTIEENLDAALNTEPLLSKFKNKYSSLEYIDLRFGNKVYDKFE